MGLGRVNQATADRYAVSPEERFTRRGERDKRYDRHGRETGLRSQSGRVYEPCVMCGKRSMVRGYVKGVRTWQCENGHCGYRDDEHGPLN